MGAAMMRFGSNLYLTAALSGLIMVTLLLLGAIVVRSVGPEKGGRVITVSEHSDAPEQQHPIPISG